MWVEMSIIISRKQALATGLKRYFTGKPCKHGHIAERISSSGSCADCRVSVDKVSKKKYYEKNKGLLKEKVMDRARRKKEEIKQYQASYREINKVKLKALSRKYYQENKENILIKLKKYRSSEERILATRVLRNNRLRDDPEYAMAVACRGMIHRVIRLSGFKKKSRAKDILGYGGIELKDHLEKLFLPGMGWHNRRSWHIDHIKPISAFFKEGITDPSIINALSNLQPLWAFDNLSKGAG